MSPLPRLALSLIALGAVLIGSVAHARRLDAYALRWDTRYDNVDRGAEKNRLQGSVRLALTVDAWSVVDLVAFASTGDDYTSRWTTLSDFTKDDAGADFSLFFRRLYLQRRWGWGRAQLGAIPPIKNVASGTGLNSSGWVDGARVEVYRGGLTLEAVGGSLGQLDTPDLFSRRFRQNFAELEATWVIDERLTVEASAEWLEDSAYLRSEGRFDVPLQGARHVGVRAEIIGNLTRSVLATEIAAEVAPLSWVRTDLADRLTVEFAWRSLDPDIGLRGALVDDFYVFGHAATASLDGIIVDGGVLRWFARGILAERPRLLAGLGLHFKA